MKHLMIALLFLAGALSAQAVDGHFGTVTVDTELVLDSTAMEEFVTTLPIPGGEEINMFFPATMLTPINHDYGFTGAGYVPYISVDTAWVDSTTVYLYFKAPVGFRDSTVVPQISFDILMADTLPATDQLNFWIMHIQGDPGMMPADSLHHDIAVVAPADSIFPGYYATPYYDLSPAVYGNHALAIERRVDDLGTVIGIVGFNIRLPRIP